MKKDANTGNRNDDVTCCCYSQVEKIDKYEINYELKRASVVVGLLLYRGNFSRISGGRNNLDFPK